MKTRTAGVPPASRQATRPALSHHGARRAADCGRDARRTLFIAVGLFLTLNAFAATPTTAITGRVTSGGAPAAGVTVTVASTALQGERTTITSGSGRFWLTALPPGRYDVTFSRAKLQTLTRRVVVELSRVTRADAVLEPSEDEESITSTAIPLSVTDTTVINSHFSDETFDRLPIRRDPISALVIAPGPLAGISGFINAAAVFNADFGMESLEQVTILRGAIPADYEATPSIFTAQTRSGGENYFFSLRDTITSADWISTDVPNFNSYDNGVEQVAELNAGGRIIKDKLWFFAGAWNGREAIYGDRSGYEAKLTWQPAAQHNLTGFFTEEQVGGFGSAPHASVGALRYTGTTGPRWTTEAVASSAIATGGPAAPVPSPRYRVSSLFAKTSYVAGDHVLSAGGSSSDEPFGDRTAFFVNDRWMLQRFTFNLGARYDDGRLAPRLTATFDVRGNGRQAITASVSEYTNPVFTPTREMTLGFATAVGTTGSIRVDALRREHGGLGKQSGAMGEFRYTLFDRFHTGASYTWLQPRPQFFIIDAENTGLAWAGVDLPIGEHEFGVTAMQHYRSQLAEEFEATLQTDLALRYSLPVSRVRLTVAADALNIFDSTDDIFVLGRTFRGWIRLRL